MEENNNNNTAKPQGENPDHKLPEGFRLVEEGEVIPAGYETRMDLTLERSITNAPKEEKMPPPFKEPEVLVQATVDPKQTPEKPKTGFSFSQPAVIHKQNAQPTKGDVQQTQQPEVKKETPPIDPRLQALDDAIKREERIDDKVLTYDDYKDSAEMYIEGWEGLLQFSALLIDKNGAPSAYGFLEEKKKKLIEQATKVLRKHPKWVMPIEVAFLGNLIPQSARIIIKARDNRKEFMKKKREDEKNNVVPEIVKSGPNKGTEKRRGPGRPSKG